jgi:DNA-directed RNA polymerase beta' subunit
MAILAVPRDFNSDYNPALEITNHDSLDGDLNFTIDGLFSTKIFGVLNNAVEYSCNCGELTGKYNIHVHCNKCNSDVEYKGLNLSKEGWIDLHEDCIHPLFYRYIVKIINESKLKLILDFKEKTTVEGKYILSDIEYPYVNIGMKAFKENFTMILTDYYERKKVKKTYEFEFIMNNLNLIFINKIAVINAKLRPAIVLNGDYTFDGINNYYNNLIKNSTTLKNLMEMEKNPLIILSLMYKNQMLVNDLYKYILNNLGNKEGAIRSELLGNRLNFTSRSVIVPLSKGYSMDDVIIPYHTALELLKPVILNKLVKIKGISFHEANRIHSAAILKYDNMLYNIAKELIKSDNIRLLINRNPTLCIGSILLLKIVDIKKDLNDHTVAINNLILKGLNGDYDGDVLNFLLVYSKKYITALEPFYPSNLIVDPENGCFNSKYTMYKDISMGLEILFSC